MAKFLMVSIILGCSSNGWCADRGHRRRGVDEQRGDGPIDSPVIVPSLGRSLPRAVGQRVHSDLGPAELEYLTGYEICSRLAIGPSARCPGVLRFSVTGAAVSGSGRIGRRRDA